MLMRAARQHSVSVRQCFGKLQRERCIFCKISPETTFVQPIRSITESIENYRKDSGGSSACVRVLTE